MWIYYIHYVDLVNKGPKEQTDHNAKFGQPRIKKASRIANWVKTLTLDYDITNPIQPPYRSCPHEFIGETDCNSNFRRPQNRRNNMNGLMVCWGGIYWRGRSSPHPGNTCHDPAPMVLALYGAILENRSLRWGRTFRLSDKGRSYAFEFARLVKICHFT